MSTQVQGERVKTLTFDGEMGEGHILKEHMG